VKHVAHMEVMNNAYKMLVWKPEGKKPLGRLRHKWENNIEKELREIGCDDVDVAQDRDHWQALVNMVMNLWFT
jgi:hypothetical protein